MFIPVIWMEHREFKGCKCQLHLTPKIFFSWERWKFKSELVTIWECLDWHFPTKAELPEPIRWSDMPEPEYQWPEWIEVTKLNEKLFWRLEHAFREGYAYGYSQVRHDFFAKKGAMDELYVHSVEGMSSHFRAYEEYDEDNLRARAWNSGRRCGWHTGHMTNLAMSGKCQTKEWQEHQGLDSSEHKAWREFRNKTVSKTFTVDKSKKYWWNKSWKGYMDDSDWILKY